MKNLVVQIALLIGLGIPLISEVCIAESKRHGFRRALVEVKAVEGAFNVEVKTGAAGAGQNSTVFKLKLRKSRAETSVFRSNFKFTLVDATNNGRLEFEDASSSTFLCEKHLYVDLGSEAFMNIYYGNDGAYSLSGMIGHHVIQQSRDEAGEHLIKLNQPNEAGILAKQLRDYLRYMITKVQKST